MAETKLQDEADKECCWSKFRAHIRPSADQISSLLAVKATVVVSRSSGRSRPGKLSTLQLYSNSQIDQNTRRGMLSKESWLKRGKKTKHGKVPTITYNLWFNLGIDFGLPGAILVNNGSHNKFFLHYVMVCLVDNNNGGNLKAHFNCRSWIYPIKKTNAGRIFFSITSYLPGQTPEALQKLREDELKNLRGGEDEGHERKEWDRIYDYAYYNDLGDPSKGQAHVRPVLGGSQSYPYPRRLRTGRPLSHKDHRTEERSKFLSTDFYVPPDERFSPAKLSEFVSNSVQAVLHFGSSLIHGNGGNFQSFEQISENLYANESRRSVGRSAFLHRLKGLLPEDLFKEAAKAVDQKLKFPIPQVIQVDQLAWKTDEEFAREMLAGLNPVVIRRLEAFPPSSKDGRQSSIQPSHIQKNLNGLTINQAMDQKKIFILDHHDYLMPYLRRINEQGECIYASRTLLFIRDDGTLKPLVIELSLPVEEEEEEEKGSRLRNSRVFLPASEGIEGALWQLAKTHVTINDSGYHQLISHWLHTHAIMEPFIIATRRQLSAMHPIHKLLEPHFKDTLHINSLARGVLLNAGGILEKTLFPGKLAMELSSAIYLNWRFEEQALPIDLLNSCLEQNIEASQAEIPAKQQLCNCLSRLIGKGMAALDHS